MASNLRVGFHERQRKFLSEAIAINPSHSKKACPELAPDPPSKSTPLTTNAIVTSKPDEKPPSTDDISYHETRKPFVVLENISEESFECLNSAHSHPKPAYVSGREETSELLSRISSFTEREPPMQNMGGAFFGFSMNPNRGG